MSSSTSSSSLPEDRGRILLSAAVAFVLAVATASILSLAWAGDRLVAAARPEFPHRGALLPVLDVPRGALPLALFLGDSTLADAWSYPELLGRSLGDEAEVRVVWWKGLEPYHYYLLLGRALALEPEVVVLVAHLRLFWRDEPLWYPDLLTLLPPRELSRALRLPFHERGVSVPRLVLASLLGAAGGDDVVLAAAGGRELARSVPGLGWLVPARLAERSAESLERRRATRFARYAEPLYAGHPALALLGAAVELAARGGARVLVVASPVPVSRLADAGLYAESDFRRRIELLRAATEANGGELLDLHRSLPRGEFRDEFGHHTPAGAKRIAAALEPALRAALDLPAAPSSPASSQQSPGAVGS